MEPTTTDRIIVIDFEATCWKGPAPDDQKQEIIEIGLAVLNTKTGEITQNQGILVKPQMSEVSLFCTQLTTITQELLDENGLHFNEAIEKLVTEYEPHSAYAWASYGDFDLNILKKQCKLLKIPYPMGSKHINVKPLFTEKFGLTKHRGMAGALNLLKIPLEGTHHRGVDDAKNIAKILHWCLQR